MQKVDWPVFLAAVACLLVATLPMAVAPDTSRLFVESAYRAMALYLGPAYLWAGVSTLGFVGYLAFGRYGGVVLGPDGGAREFDNLSWFSMLFCAWIASGLLYWGVIEWAYYFQSPPYGAEVGSPSAIEWATSYGLFHWGPSAWAIYCLPTIAIAYPYYVRKVPFLRLSTAVMSYLPNGINSPRGRFIDFLFMINLIGGTGTSLGLSSPMIAGGLAQLLDLEHDFVLEVYVVVLSIAIFGTSAFLGLKKDSKN